MVGGQYAGWELGKKVPLCRKVREVFLVQTDTDLWGTSLTNAGWKKILGASQVGGAPWIGDLPRVSLLPK